MFGPGCEGCTATSTTASPVATATTVSMALPLLVVQIGTTVTLVTVFARSFILGNERQIIIQFIKF